MHGREDGAVHTPDAHATAAAPSSLDPVRVCSVSSGARPVCPAQPAPAIDACRDPSGWLTMDLHCTGDMQLDAPPSPSKDKDMVGAGTPDAGCALHAAAAFGFHQKGGLIIALPAPSASTAVVLSIHRPIHSTPCKPNSTPHATSPPTPTPNAPNTST